ncbi:hypothetical protein ALC53_08717 [Atta colombica]|uniref:Uncharacterized protein n=1 Tax=Atta colombica TaxID=520822 RepID=A0A151I245_9HYME|nr:hypothetical protein ALC53_08717 [Atta colombica]
MHHLSERLDVHSFRGHEHMHKHMDIYIHEQSRVNKIYAQRLEDRRESVAKEVMAGKEPVGGQVEEPKRNRKRDKKS